MRFACNRFENDEDRRDFIQEFYCLAWASWKENDFARFGEDGLPDIYFAKALYWKAAMMVSHRQRCGEVLGAIAAAELWDTPDMSLGDMLDAIPDRNPARAKKTKLWKLRLTNGIGLRLDFGQITELTGMCRDAITRSREAGRPLKVWKFEDTITGSPTGLAQKMGVPRGQIRNKVQAIELMWDEL